MTVFLYIVTILWSIRIVANLLSYIHLWYVKEYRIDRMLIHLSTKQGRRLLFLPWRRPPLSPKSLFMTVLGVCICVWLYAVLPYMPVINLLVLDVLLFPVTILLVIISKIPTSLYHGFVINRAVAKLRRHKKMKVIGVTGSFGKTSTKEILYTLLRRKYPTLKTDASKNSPIAIAELILRSLKADHEVFIVEMGAYKKGEIAQMCAMVLPEIGIVTAVNAQHQDLFGSIENTMQAKYELIGGLQGEKFAILNADNVYTKKMADWALRDNCHLVQYTTGTIKNNQQDYVRASHIRATESGLSFDVGYANQKGTVTVPLLGKHHVSNILAAFAAALSCGMKFDEAIQACGEITAYAKTMQLVKGRGGVRYIDDTFNNNPDAAIAAIDFLATTTGKKILVFQPMIELGAYADKSHRDVGSYAAKYCDDIILTNDNYLEPFMQGVREFDARKKVSVLTPESAASRIRHTAKDGDTVLFKGKESARTYHLLMHP